MLAPNKQNLLLLKTQQKLVKNGHKLLKEKRSGLIYTFLEMSREGKQLEKKVSKELQKILSQYDRSMIFVSSEALNSILEQVPVMDLVTQKKRVSGVYVDTLKITLRKPKRKGLKKDIKLSLDIFANYFSIILKLSQIRLNVQKVAVEIQKVSRQISNLENKMDSIASQIKFIQSALMEKSNFEKATLIKVFNN